MYLAMAGTRTSQSGKCPLSHASGFHLMKNMGTPRMSTDFATSGRASSAFALSMRRESFALDASARSTSSR